MIERLRIVNPFVIDTASASIDNATAEFDAGELADLLIVSGVSRCHDELDGMKSETVPGLTVKVTPAAGKKCSRCWKFHEDVGEDELCPRCHSVVAE